MAVVVHTSTNKILALCTTREGAEKYATCYLSVAIVINRCFLEKPFHTVKFRYNGGEDQTYWIKEIDRDVLNILIKGVVSVEFSRADDHRTLYITEKQIEG